MTHDAKGNLTSDPTKSTTQTYAWDFDNRLASAVVGSNTHTYKYDALGRRVSKAVMTGGSAPAADAARDRANVALGTLYLKRGRFADAEKLFRFTPAAAPSGG